MKTLLYPFCRSITPAVVSGEFKKALAGGTENLPALLNDNNVYFLTGGWYKVSGNITFNHEIIFTDDVHIVLEDGCQMIVIPNSTARSITAIRGKNDSDLYIHGGSTGKLIVQYVNNLSSSIATHDFYVLGGDVSVIGVNSDNAVYATGDVYISGGNISASYDKITAHEGNVYVSGGTVTGTLTTLNYNTVYVSGGKISGTLKSRYVNITGGQVDAAINYEYGLVLGCNSADDYININSIGYSDTRAVTNIAPGVILKDKEGNEYQDSLTLDEAKALNGKKLTYSRENNVDFNVNVQAAYFGTITADKVTAQYGDKVSLTVTPKTGYIVKSVKYGDTVIVPDSDGNYSFNMPRSDVNVTAEFEKQKFTVTWKNWDGTVLETDEEVEYGSAPFYDGEEPVKAGAVFTGWDNEFSAVTGNVSYTAQFDSEVNKYTVTWKNGDTVLETDENVEYGTTPEYNGEIPTKPMDDDYTYTFSGWSPEISSVEGDIIYTAQFTATERTDKCGDKAYWEFDSESGKLTISGSGAMYNYGNGTQPWNGYRNNITSVEIENGITSIGKYAFCYCQSLKSITIPDSVTSMGDDAFLNCLSLASITIPKNVTSIGQSAFYACTGLTSIEIPKNVTSIGADAFRYCTNIKDVYCYADPDKLTWNEYRCNDFMGAPESRETVCHVPAEYLSKYVEKFGGSVNVTFVGNMGLGEHLYGHSITLDGSIGVNFYVELTDELLASDTAAMIFTVPNGSKTDTQTLLVKDVIANDKNKVSIGSRTYYKFKCNVSAKDMTSTITAQLVDGEKSGKEYTYSVKDYAEYILEHKEVEEFANAAPLVKAMLNYGAASQTYFGIEGTAANDSLTETDKALGDVTIPETFKFNEANATLPEGVTFEGATLSLKSETTLSLYFKGLPADTKFICDGKTVETAKNGEYVVARIRGIKANELENDFTVTFEGDSVTYNVTYNVMTYCYNVLNDSTVDDNLQNVCKALYKYAQAAINYAG